MHLSQCAKCPNINICSNIVKDQRQQSGPVMSAQQNDNFIHLLFSSVSGCMVWKADGSHFLIKGTCSMSVVMSVFSLHAEVAQIRFFMLLGDSD